MNSKWKRAAQILLVIALVLATALVAEAKKPAQPPGNGKHEGPDPCGQNCGNGDHGRGNPGNPGRGSENANCNASHGEVDPRCEPDPVPQPFIPTVEPPPVVVEQDKRPGKKQQLRGVVASVLEIFSNEHLLEEDYVLAELDSPWEYLDFHAPAGESYGFLWWGHERGHEGMLVYVCVESASDDFVLVSPFLREAKKVNGVYMAPAFLAGNLLGKSDQEICAILKHLANGGEIWPKTQVMP